jgi:retron-type reverse transcriptase
MQLELFDSTIPLEDIFAAYYECRKNKRNRSGALQFEIDLESNLVGLWEEINSGTWEPRPSTVFIVEKPVIREIFAASFRDRIVHHLVIGRLNDLFEKIFIYDSYSCRKGKGTHLGVSRASRFIRRRDPAWVLKIDLRGYFMSINRSILYRKLVLFIDKMYHAPDKDRIKELCRIIVFNEPAKNCIFHSPSSLWNQLPKDKSLFTARQGCGLPIGNLTSQVFANFYLTEFDHFIKKDCGITDYGRYVDDFYILSSSEDPEYYRYLRKEIDVFLHEKLQLNLHPKKFYYSKGVPFLGLVTYPYQTVPNRRNKKNYLKATPEKKQDYIGFLMHHNTYKLLNHHPPPL